MGLTIPFLTACNDFQGIHAGMRSETDNPSVTEYQYQTMKDARFLVSAAGEYLQGIHMGQLALDRSESKKVKELARSIKKERSESLNQLQKIAEKKLILIPADLPFERLNPTGELNMATGPEFDRIYCTMVEMDQRQTINELEQQIRSETDKDITDWAYSRLPYLRSQLDLAIETRKQTEKMNY